ncbi:MAG: hypothetical protein HY815_04385 [Candidatus Riflebacteria bacterium]|nr:hypothetical protein [Candidatus Riflebacteria bacterium]
MFLCLVGVGGAQTAVPAAQAPASVATPEPLMFVNDPRNLTFVSMSRVAQYLQAYYASHGITKPEDVDAFYQVLHAHGAPFAGQDESKVALVVQDPAYPENKSGTARGVLVIQGRFDHDKVMETLRKHYTEHMTKTGHTPVFNALKNEENVPVKKFLLEARKRELTVAYLGQWGLFSSAAIGDYELLNKTIATLKAGQFTPVTEGASAVKYTIHMSTKDRVAAVKLMDKKYRELQEGKLRLQKRKNLSADLTKKVQGIDFKNAKVKFVEAVVAVHGDTTIEIQRNRGATGDVKTVTLTTNFLTFTMSRVVKAKLIKHLNDIVKNASADEKTGIDSDVKIFCEGRNHLVVTCKLATAEEQMKCFSFISSFAARTILMDREVNKEIIQKGQAVPEAPVKPGSGE